MDFVRVVGRDLVVFEILDLFDCEAIAVLAFADCYGWLVHLDHFVE